MIVEFEGFRPADFGELEGSTWRGRASLGGVLARDLRDQLGRPFQSWGVRRRLELHLAYPDAYDFYDPWPYAKLFVYTWKNVEVGLYLETPGLQDPRDSVDRYVHWRNFRDRLQTSTAIQTALLAAMINHSMYVRDLYRSVEEGALGCQFRASGGRMQRRDALDGPWVDVKPDSLFRRLAQLPEEKWVDLHVFTAIPQQEAIDLGPGVSGRILTILRALAPVYDMVVSK
ncbi:MAG: hypothetical protein JXM73_25155 [Anaerolineae bacterium]|nr:hypothetical protein [Anaerolineae bacterium]